jgi:menaquinone-dependent protoporphyrinogen oxidase
MEAIPTMGNRVLVAYATTYGSTAEIAEEAARVLSAKGAEVRVCDVQDVMSIDDYDSVVLGTSIRLGRPVKGMRTFLRRHSRQVAEKPNVVFSVGATLHERTPASYRRAENSVASVVDAVSPMFVGMFGGKLDPDSFRWPWPVVAERVGLGALAPGDWRDWDEIDRWFEAVAPRLIS